MIFIQFSYVLAAILFILGIRSLGSPVTARRGMHLAALGMFIAVRRHIIHAANSHL